MNLFNWLASRASSKWHLPILCILAAIVILLPAGKSDLRGPDEGRYAQVAKELLTSDNWLALTVKHFKNDLTSTATLPKLLALKGVKVKIDKLKPIAMVVGFSAVSDDIITKEHIKLYVRNNP